MVQSNATLRLILALLVLCALGAGSGSVQASPSGHAPHGTVTIDSIPQRGTRLSINVPHAEVSV